MATFDLSSAVLPLTTAYKFHIQNHTRNTGLYFDIGLLTQGSKTQWISGPDKGTLAAGGEAICNFDLLISKSQPYVIVPEITNLKIAQRFQEGSISLFNVNNTPISLRFWDGGVENQYINFINDGPVNVKKDTSEFNEVRFNNYRFTLDSGEHNNDTMNIFFQLYDA